jgi:hypothetical protein
MKPSNGSPLFRTLLYPVLSDWNTGMGTTSPVLRFVVMASWSGAARAALISEMNIRLWPALLAPELPYSLMPRALHLALGAPEEDMPPAWRLRSVPAWRGIPCRFRTVTMRVINEVVRPEPTEFRVLVLVPDRDPPGPRLDHVLLGTEFFTHYTLRVTVDYSSLSHLPETTARRRYDPSVR